MLTVCIALAFVSMAQRYDCLKPGIRQYFVNGNGYLRGMRIDSVRAAGTDTIYYPFHTQRGRYTPNRYPTRLDTNGGSWLGKRVLCDTAGIWYFDNLWGDTIAIRSQANTGDTWVFYSDTSLVYYMATVDSVDTLTVLNQIDSVKYISLRAFDTGGFVIGDALNTYQLILSRDHGFVSVFDLYTFPYHKTDSTYIPGLDFFLDFLIGPPGHGGMTAGDPRQLEFSRFQLIDFKNPTMAELYDWHAGDIAQYKIVDQEYQSITVTSWTTVRYLVELDSVAYDTAFAGNRFAVINGPVAYDNPLSAFHYTMNGTPGYLFTSRRLFDTTLMPEEYRSTYPYFSGRQSAIYYYSNDTSFCRTSPKFILVPTYCMGDESPFHFEGPYFKQQFKVGLGLLNDDYQGMGSMYREWQFTDLVYFRGSGWECGNRYVTTSVAQTSHPGVSIYPNPVSDALYAELAGDAVINLYDLAGQMLLHQSVRGNTTVDVSRLPAGSYIAELKSADGCVYHQRLSIVH